MILTRITCTLLFLSTLYSAQAKDTTSDSVAEEKPPMTPAMVTIEESADGYTLAVDGEPYWIEGAATKYHLEELKATGANTIRTWDVTGGTGELLDRAHALGLKVILGYWLGHERHGFNYNDASQREKQFKRVQKAVRRFKDHPALLIWAIGNETEGFGKTTNPFIWKHIDDIAEMIKREDPNHPTMTVIQNAPHDRIESLHAYCPHIDILGINSYSSILSIAEDLKDNKWERPYIITEFGPPGYWEVQHKTPWDAAREHHSEDKAANYFVGWNMGIEKERGHCLGGFVFYWGQKQEATATWYGMFLKDGSRLPSQDVMAKIWTGEWPQNRCPKLESITSEADGKYITPGQIFTAQVKVKDLDGDSLTYKWVLSKDYLERGVGGAIEKTPETIQENVLVNGSPTAKIEAPKRKGAYRLFIYVYDGNGNAATANIPFYVRNSLKENETFAAN